MAGYAAIMTRTASNAASLGTITAGATRARRTEWYDYTLGCSGAPADNIFLWQIQRFTAPGTNTAVTPQPLDPADFATESTVGQLNTVEPTYTANQILDVVPLNQRATYRWWCSDTSRLVTPATASNGLGIATPTATALTIYAKVLYNER